MRVNNYTMELRLCDQYGLVSRGLVDDGTATLDRCYLDRVNRLRALTPPYGEHGPVDEPFPCTGSAHLAGEHIKCTSLAHQGIPEPVSLIDFARVVRREHPAWALQQVHGEANRRMALRARRA